ncbi:MAG: sodium:solute symporter [Stygiobacter sp. RIFOXYC12_FULL_38_8]|nr:MAG: sodium:solute symporter [Stygiobacter sp. GWC2_38_9]OGU81887.1 MAG: sodium:solute symporter [Stygiobacter sp. RIFOXYA12_FULL_38_9]OGV06132.1 MAG: sodium:solute symporter [Stygiobacter sp. RIFOXYB2_FULL_37_11]OGV11371.1 MAG: sodium:solute symporter [Stygiobacter sp. RIFOXYA2_FULL_38_8]OGV16803.1 MAG: sodium:solute symporter [Stygiobacter sp. RIFOXYC2_FULL_38_25]OGV29408.1 MAG: sodium:solute symporter [Stygiobacter sp. RIFOXYC12_FULL_38_8]OGV82846.1 MAG: sodium:solute symporter [Stygiob
MQGSLIDYVIIGVYLVGIAIFGIISGGKQKTVKDYFLGSKVVPWWAVCFSIVAAETSTLTFISIPGLAYLTNLNFLQVTFGYLLGRIVVAFVFLPAYSKGELKTAYTFLENRFGGKTRSFASIVFLFTRLAADGVRLFATAIPLKLMIDIGYPEAIAIMALVALIYTYTGGVKGIIWVDVIQMFTYLGGAILAGIFLLNLIPGGWGTVVSTASASGKLSILNLGFDKGFSGFFSQPYTLIGGLLGGAFLSMASHGTDQLIVQRLLATKNLRESQKAIIGSGVIVIIQFVIFLIVGVMLYTYYGAMDVKSDTIFPKFIIEVLPPGVIGIIIAGLFAAALSTLAGSVSSLASSTMMDLYIPFFGKRKSESAQLKISRLFTIMWTVLLVFAALFFMNTTQTVVELALSIASFTYGGLLGTFLLGILVKNAREKDALISFAAGIIIMIFVITFKLVAWTWFTIVGVSATLLVGGVLSSVGRRVKSVER